MKTLLAAAFVLIAVPAAYAEDAKPSGATQQQQQAADQSYQEEKAQEKALKEGKAWTK
jgi:ABC-type transporter MlaC component